MRPDDRLKLVQETTTPGLPPWSLIGPGCLIRGDLVLSGNLLVHGRVEGVVFTDGEVWVGPDGSVEGGIHAGRILVEGTCRGRLEALEGVHLRRGSVVHAEIEAPDLRIDHGARHHGERTTAGTPRIARWRDAWPHNA